MKKPIGRVYILTNKCMPNLVKIGYTMNSVENRIIELMSTGVPFPFEVEFQIECRDPEAVEKCVHNALAQHRVNPDREFFEISPTIAAKQILETAKEILQVEVLDVDYKQNFIGDYSTVEGQFKYESENITDWIEIPTSNWSSFVSFKNSIKKNDTITVWEMLSYRQEMKEYSHRSSIIRKIYSLNNRTYRILYKGNYDKPRGLGNLISVDDLSQRDYPVFPRHPFEVVFNYVCARV